MSAHIATWLVSALSVGGVMLRPFRTPEAVWAATGAAILVVFERITPGLARAGIERGADVYLFLTGMMLLAEGARSEGLFDWLAALAASFFRGAPRPPGVL